MPNPPVRRHPLFLRLLKPIEPIYPDAVTAVTWDDDEPIDEVEGIVYIVTQPCAQMSTWAKQLRKLHRADRSYKTDVEASSLSAAPISPPKLLKIGKVRRELFNDSGRTVKTVRAGTRLYLSQMLMAVVLDRVGGNAVGFVSFRFDWAIDAFAKEKEEIEFEVEPDQVWIDPEFRGRGWGTLMAIAIAFATFRHVNQLEASARWPKRYTARLAVTLGADICSTSGERFLSQCALFTSFQFDFVVQKYIEVTEVEFDPRW